MHLSAQKVVQTINHVESAQYNQLGANLRISKPFSLFPVSVIVVLTSKRQTFVQWIKRNVNQNQTLLMTFKCLFWYIRQEETFVHCQAGLKLMASRFSGRIFYKDQTTKECIIVWMETCEIMGMLSRGPSYIESQCLPCSSKSSQPLSWFVPGLIFLREGCNSSEAHQSSYSRWEWLVCAIWGRQHTCRCGNDLWKDMTTEPPKV